MPKTSTPDSPSIPTTQTINQPKASTIAFLRQFARCYVAAPALSASLAGIVAN